MKSISYRGFLLVLPLLLLTHCGGGKSDEQITEVVAHTAARTGVEWSARIKAGAPDLSRLRPSGLLGVYVAHYLRSISSFRSAMKGIEAIRKFIAQEDFERGEDFALLEQIGTILQVDIADMLNRSADRAQAFDVYVEELTKQLKLGAARLGRLEQELEALQDERRAKRKHTSGLQHDLNLALREQNYANAGSMQEQLIQAEADLARVETEQDQAESIINLYEDLLKIGDRRLLAMKSNREILIAGLKVIEVPGIDNLGILEEADRKVLREQKGQYDYLFEGL